MKKLFGLALVIALSCSVKAQSPGSIPQVVRAAFSTAYPDATDVRWEKEKGNYEAEFRLPASREMSVVYDASGNLKETEQEIAFEQLPKPVQDAVAGKKVRESARITDSSGTVTYEVEVKHRDVLFDVQVKRLN